MQKIKKLILTGGIFSSSLFFNPGYAQNNKEEAIDQTIKEIEMNYGIKKVGGSYYYKDGRKADVSITPIYSSNGNKWGTNYSIKSSEGKTETGNYNTKYGTYNTKKEYSDKNGVNRVTQYSNPNKTYTPTKKTYTPIKHKTDLGDVLNTTNAALNVVNLGLNIANLIQNNQKQKNINTNYSAPPVNNPPTNYNSNPEDNKKAFDEWLNELEKTENKKAFDEWLNDDPEENKKAFDEWLNDDPEENKKAFDEWLNGKESNKIKSLDDVLKEQEQKKAEAKLRSEKTSRELSDFVEKQAGASPETKIWFDKEYQEAEEFYKEYYKNDPEAYAKTKDLDKLHKVIGYESYKLAKKYTPAGQALEAMEIYEDIKEKGIENYWKEEVKEADEFLKQYELNPKLKVISNEKNLEEKLGTDVYVPKFKEDKYSEQINKIAYGSDVSKVIRYRAYQHAKNQTEAGEIIEGIEKVDEIKKNDSKFFWDE